VTNYLPVDSLAKKPRAKELEMLPKEIQDNIEPGHVAPSDMKFAWSCGQNRPQQFRKHFSDKGKQVGTHNLSILRPATSSTLQKLTLSLSSDVLYMYMSMKRRINIK
jgi:hypothetical protein